MREQVLAEWLSHTEWANWDRHAITGDASSRRYERLFDAKGSSVILMDAPIETCGSQKTFVTMAKHLCSLGLAAPEVLEWSDSLGLMVLRDLGDMDFAQHLKLNPSDETLLYRHAVDVLRKLQSSPPPAGLPGMNPEVGVEMLALAFDWAAIDQSADLRAEIENEMYSLLIQVDPSPSALSLRDYHAENLIWRNGCAGIDRVGLLDFQDAFITHPTYDLASLLRDARRDVSASMLDELLLRLNPDADQGSQRTAFHVMAVQRNLRILGIFQRLAQRDGKARYLDFVPRVKNHLRADLASSPLGSFGALVNRAFLEDLN
ncbi:phosphotransferase [Octadecabacter sp.]|nr:phosphotransferase [Octadecabacter sp.]